MWKRGELEKLPIRALSPGSSWDTNCSAADRTRRKLLIMLPLRSSMSTMVIGWTPLSKRVIGWSLPLS